MSEAQNTQAVGKTSPIRLRDALRRAFRTMVQRARDAGIK